MDNADVLKPRCPPGSHGIIPTASGEKLAGILMGEVA